jgi:hypothetical protein
MAERGGFEPPAQVLARTTKFLSRAEKRRLLQTLIPEIHVENYGVTKIAVLVQDSHRDEVTRTGRDSWPRLTYAATGKSPIPLAGGASMPYTDALIALKSMLCREERSERSAYIN